ncbi:Gfo/Idh/MocA family protein [Novipirellula artificiosorum]|uniref:Inositol 2-dehydrogenase n=1 Tax=Novipirellula artificiosorum TaxID=2528016 RepID=A0A5C6E1T8_9BACT|nr:Gfo/Idh/MocA family oxidoreductase [Novipirellula artificiosorum]TWU41957.1 Inositol 2-dehydrogenase [Novipirellula artificiosorum]
MSQSKSTSRRTFLTQTAAATTCIAAASSRRLFAAANDRLNVAFIGVGGRGGVNLKTIAGDASVNVVALCDVNRKNLEKAAQNHPKARTYEDFRLLYDDTNDYDAVVVSTSEHTHAYATMPALKLGKHVYCEKPLTHNVYEARAITKAAADAGVVTQMGTQIHAGSNYHRVVELVQSGAIGKVREVHTWVGRAWGLQSPADAKANGDTVSVQQRPTEAMTPPDFLNWDLWLGPAQYRPFHEVYFPGPKWYRWWDFGNGTMSDLGSHWNDLAYWAMKFDAPKTIEAFGDDPHPEIAPASMSAVYHYDARGNLPAAKHFWYQGTHKPEIWKSKGIPQWNSGTLFVGDKGMLLSDYGKHLLLPEDEFKDFEPPTPFVPDSPGHHQQWIDACRGEGQTGSPFSYAGPLTEANHLGNVAFRVGRAIDWDAASMKVPHADADRFLRRIDPRDGWSLS